MLNIFSTVKGSDTTMLRRDAETGQKKAASYESQAASLSTFTVIYLRGFSFLARSSQLYTRVQYCSYL